MYLKSWKTHFLMHISTLVMALPLASCVDKSEGNTTREDPAPCLGFIPPTLTVKAADSITETALAQAMVTVYVPNGQSGISAQWDEERQGHVLSGISLEPGMYDVVVLQDGYHAAVTKNTEFREDASCGATNDWDVSVYLCPIGTACI